MPSKSKSSRPKENNSSKINRVIIGSVIGAVLFFMFIALFSVLVLKTDAFSSSFYMPAGLMSGAVSSFLCGFITVRPIKKNGAALGALSGLVQALICSAAIFFINSNNSGVGIFILMAVIVAFGAVGGISAVNLKIRKKY